MRSNNVFKNVKPEWLGVAVFVSYLYAVWAGGWFIRGVFSGADRGGAGSMGLMFYLIPIGIGAWVAAYLVLLFLFNRINNTIQRTGLVVVALTTVVLAYGFPGYINLIIGTGFAVNAYREESREAQDEEDLAKFE